MTLAASPTDPIIREKALEYFLKNFSEKYKNVYDSAKVNVAFLPCLNPSIYANSSECFTNPECTIIKFNTIRKNLKTQVMLFGIHSSPTNEELKNRLSRDPPKDVEEATKIFEYLGSRSGYFDWTTLADFNFISIKDKLQPNVIICTLHILKIKQKGNFYVFQLKSIFFLFIINFFFKFFFFFQLK